MRNRREGSAGMGNYNSFAMATHRNTHKHQSSAPPNDGVSQPFVGFACPINIYAIYHLHCNFSDRNNNRPRACSLPYPVIVAPIRARMLCSSTPSRSLVHGVHSEHDRSHVRRAAAVHLSCALECPIRIWTYACEYICMYLCKMWTHRTCHKTM